jgi:hypothetical protein
VPPESKVESLVPHRVCGLFLRRVALPSRRFWSGCVRPRVFRISFHRDPAALRLRAVTLCILSLATLRVAHIAESATYAPPAEPTTEYAVVKHRNIRRGHPVATARGGSRGLFAPSTFSICSFIRSDITIIMPKKPTTQKACRGYPHLFMAYPDSSDMILKADWVQPTRVAPRGPSLNESQENDASEHQGT